MYIFLFTVGFGVDQLRDDNLETYWQSDGSQPHLVNIQFRYSMLMYTYWTLQGVMEGVAAERVLYYVFLYIVPNQ